MKFNWFSKLVAMAMMVVSIGVSQAQVTTYFSDAFTKGVTDNFWDLSASSSIKPGTTAYAYQLNGINSIMIGWAYDASGADFGSAKTEIKGDYDLVSKPFQMGSSDYDHVLTFDYYYKSASTASATNRNFFVKYKVEGGEWTTAYTMYEDGASLEQVLTPKRISVALPASVAGKKVQVSLGIRNNVTDGSMFAMLVGNVNFGAWHKTANMAAEIVPGIPSSEGVMEAVFANTSREEVTACKYKFRLNGKVEQQGELTIGSALAPGATVNAELKLNMADMMEGKNFLEVWAYEVNGAAVDKSDTSVFSFANVDASQVDKYRPLIEFFSSSTCPYCANASTAYKLYLDDLATKKNLLSVIKYQMNMPGTGDPYYIGGNGNRYNYYSGFYGYTGIPQSVYDGQTQTSSWGSYTVAVGKLRSSVMADSRNDALLSIRFDTLTLDTVTGKLEYTVQLTPIVDMKANLISVVVEGTTTGNKMTNTETEFHWVSMAFPAGAFGEEVELQAGEVKTFTYTVDLSTTFMEEYSDVEVVCFFQDYTTGKMYQSAVYDYDNPPTYDNGDDEDPGVGLEDASASSHVRIYPNPAKDQVFFAGLEKASVKIFDMGGRLVKDLKSVSEGSVVNISDLSQGTYVIRIIDNGSVINRKLSVIR